MKPSVRTTGRIAVLMLLAGGSAALAECARLHESLDSAAAITASGGVISGTLAFVAGINGNAAAFDGGTQVTHASGALTASAGSLALWVRRSGVNGQGGIAEIGVIGQPTSLGLFYFNDTDLVFEMRNDAGVQAAVWAPGVLSASAWTHVVASWRDHAEGTDLWLFVNGRYVNYAFLAGHSTRTATALRIGATGYYGGGQVSLDEVRYFDWFLHDGEVYAEYVISANRHNPQPTGKPVSTGPVRVIDGALYVHGRPFAVRGVGYQPTPIGMYPDPAGLLFMYTDPGILTRDLPLLRGLHVNTVRTWSPPPDLTLLDALYNDGANPIYILLGYWFSPYGVNFADPAETAPLEAAFAALVTQFKDHPGLLGWGIGNEVNLSVSDAQMPHFFAFADKLAQIAHAIEGDAYHPTVLVNGFMVHLGDQQAGSDDGSLPNIDIWGQNVYFGYDPHCTFEYYQALTRKPLIVTEFGIDALDDVTGLEHPAVHADFVVRQWRYIERYCLGGAAFEYCDEWWKAGSPASHDFGGYGTHWHPDGYSNEEWYGLVAMSDAGGAPDVAALRLAYHRLATEFAHHPGDYDADGDVDLRDYAAFQRCAGASVAGACGAAFEFDVDDQISAGDVGLFAAYLTGPAAN